MRTGTALGAVHSVETWIDGELVGGLYGVNLGRMFFGESMFARRTDASKIALAALVCFCRSHGIDLIDCQQNTGHLASLGAREMPRAEFERELRQRVGAAGAGRLDLSSGHVAAAARTGAGGRPGRAGTGARAAQPDPASGLGP